MTSEHNQDITLINQVEEKSHNIESYFYAIFNNSTDPIFIKNIESKFILVNNAFCSLFGVSRDEVIGFTHTERLPLGEIAHFLSVDRQVFETGIEVLYEELLSLNEVEPKVVTIKKSRYIDSKGHCFLVGVIHDITEKKHLEQENNDANRERIRLEDELVIAKKEKVKREDELTIAKEEKVRRADELEIAKEEKVRRADELVIAKQEKGKREDELVIAKEEKVRRADELIIAKEEKGKRADELVIAKEEKVRRADELVIANKELAFQNEEKDKRANELVIANKELAFQNEEKDKRADKLVIANKEKDRRADELVIANEEKDKRADELVIANKEKDKRANKLVIANQEKDKRADELVIANRELSLQNEKNEDLLRKLKLAASVFTSANESIMITDATGIIIEVNDAFSRITGYSPEEVLGKNSSFLQSGRQSPEFHAEIWAVLLAKGHWRNEMWSRRKNGEVYPEMMTISAVKSATGILQHCVSLGTDITELKAYQGQLEHIAHFDVLTNLPNRALLADRLGQAMVQCQRNHRKLAVAFMDLDGFKEINDNHGHDVGDKLLIEVSQRMKVSLREGDTLARIGGDEFIAVMNNLEKPEDSMPILEGLLQAAAVPVNVDNMVLKVSASIGVSICPEDGLDADQLMRHADQAMYEAKQAGKNRYRLFDNALANSVKAQLESITNIRIALDKCEFVLHYQPKVNMQTGEVIGVEALIRWQHPIHGLVPPLEFLPVIEGKAISLKLGEWVINSALTQIFQWKNMGIYLPISVNITAYQLQQVNFTTRLSAMLLAHPEVSPSYLELEILETSALKDISKVSATMQACNILGVRFALDDFGTGYSSLTYLKHLPAHLIKIDKSFVRDMLEDTDDLAIVKGVVGLAKAFQRDVIAEGVETIAHGIALLELGCELAQGYGIARPMPADDIPKWFSNWKTKDTWHE